MNDLEHQLGDLLEQAAGQPPRQIDAHGVRRSARRQTRAIAGVSSALAVVLALAVALPLSLAGNDGPAAEDVVAPPSPDRSVLPVDPTTYTLNAELFWSAKSGLTGCYVIALSAPPTGCSGIPVSTDMAPTALPTAERLSTGDVLTGPLHLVGHWDGHALVLSEKPSPTGQVTNGIAPDCPPPVSDAAVTTLTERVSGDDADLRSRGIAIISMGQCGGDVLIQVAAATPATVAYLMATYKDVIVYGWLVPLTGEPTPTETPNVAPIPASTPVVVPAGAPFTVLSRIDVGGAPVRLLQADGALFAMICCAENSGRASSIVRIDQATERVTATAHPGDAKGIAFDAGYLWAVDDGVAGHPVVAALDPTTLKTIRTVALPESGADLAVAGGYLWVAGRNALYRVDPGSGSLASSVPVDNADAADGGFLSLAASAYGTALWTTEASSGGGGPVAVQERDPRSGRVLASTAHGPVSASGAQIAASDGHAWIALPTGMLGGFGRLDADGSRLIVAARPADERNTGSFANGLSVHLAGGRLWLLDDMSGSAACADEATGRILVRSRIDGLTDALADLGSDRLAVGAGNDVLVVRPKPACTP